MPKKEDGIAYDHVGYAVSLCSSGSSGISITPMKFHQMTSVCFFVRVPGTFSGVLTSIFSTKERMIYAVSSVMSVYLRTMPMKESTFSRSCRASAIAVSSSAVLASSPLLLSFVGGGHPRKALISLTIRRLQHRFEGVSWKNLSSHIQK